MGEKVQTVREQKTKIRIIKKIGKPGIEILECLKKKNQKRMGRKKIRNAWKKFLNVRERNPNWKKENLRKYPREKIKN